MSEYRGSILEIPAGTDVPDDFLTSITKDFPDVAGFATTVDGGIIQFSQAEPAPVDEIQKLLSEYKDSTSWLFFGKWPTEGSENSVQPFQTVVEEDDTVVCVAFLDGNFDARIPEGTNESGEFVTHEEYIKDALKRVYKASGKSVDEFMQEVSTDPSIPKTMKLLYEGRGNILILAQNGEHVMFGDNALLTTFDWGGISTNPGSYKEQAEEAAPEAPKRSGFGSRGPVKPAAGQRTAPAGTVSSAVTPPNPSALPGGNALKAPATGSSAAAQTVLHKSDAGDMEGPPINLTTKNEIQRWYAEHNNGVIPKDWKNRPKIVDQKPDKNAMSKQLADVNPIDQKQFEKVEYLPVISPKSLQWFKETFVKRGTVQKTISEGKVTFDPKRIEQLETEYASFLEANGLDGWNQVYGWEGEDILNLCTVAPDQATRMILDLLYNDYKVWKTMDGASSLVKEEKETVTKPTPNRPAKPASGFGNRKAS